MNQREHATTEMDLPAAIAGERRDEAAMLAALPPDAWNAPTLCEGWRVREVVAHQTMPFRYRGWRFVLEMLKAGGNFTCASDRIASRDAGTMSSGELIAAMADNADFQWRPPGAGLPGALSHDVIHGLDITVALGIDRQVPSERLEVAIEQVTSRRRNPFGVDLDGVCLHADDIDWTFGSGAPVTGAAQHLLLVYCGRHLPAGLLHGEASARFVRRGS